MDAEVGGHPAAAPLMRHKRLPLPGGRESSQ